MAERRQRANAMELAERCAAGLEERLRRDHQNAHRWVIFSRNRSTVAAPFSMSNEQPDHSPFGRRVSSSLAQARVSVVLLRFCSHGWTWPDCGQAPAARRSRWLLVALGLYAVSFRRARPGAGTCCSTRRTSGFRGGRCSGPISSPPSSTIFCRATSAATSCASAIPPDPPGRRRSRRPSCSSIASSD